MRRTLVHRKGEKMCTYPPKKQFFPEMWQPKSGIPGLSWLISGIPEMSQLISGISWNEPAQTRNFEMGWRMITADGADSSCVKSHYSQIWPVLQVSKFSYTIKNSWIQTTTRRNIYTGTIILANRWRRVYFREFLIWAGSFQEFLIWAGSFREFLILAGQVAETPEINRFFGGFYLVLTSFFCL